MTYTEDDFERVARAICNAHRTWPGRSAERQREIVEAAWPSHVEEARAALAAMPDGREAALEEAAKVAGEFDSSHNDGHPGVAGAIAAAIRALKAQPASGGWNFDMSVAPKDRTVLVYAAEYDGLPGFQSTAAWHPDAGWCVDELRPVVAWRLLPRSPEK